MKILRYLAVAALLLPIAACDDDETTTPTPEPVVGIVQGTVTIEGEALQGVTVTLAGPTSATTTTDAAGAYAFQNVEAGIYSISLSNLPNDATFTNPTQQVTIASNGQVANASFTGNFIRTAAITGVVLIDEEPASGVNVSLEGTETQNPQATSGLGTFAFTGLRSGSYTVSIESPAEDVSFGNLSQSVTLAVGQTAQLTFAGFVPQEPTVSIEAITTGTTITPVNPGNVAGLINFSVSFDGGDETAERVSVWLRDEGGNEIEVGAQSFSSGSGAAGSDTYTMSLNTARLTDCDNTNSDPCVTPEFINQDWTPFARLNTVEGTTVTGEWRDPLTFNNLDRLEVVRVPGNDGTIVGTRRWWGGSDQLDLRGRAVIYSQDITVSSLGVQCMASGMVSLNHTGAADLGSGAGAVHLESGNPADYSITSANNLGGPENMPFAVADVDGNGTVGNSGDFGHSCMVASVIDDSNVERLPEILTNNTAAVTPLWGLLLDYVGPVTDRAAAVDTNLNGVAGDSGDAALVVTPSDISYSASSTSNPATGATVDAAIAGALDFDDDGTAGTAGRWFQDVTFGLTNVQELGAGWGTGGMTIGRNAIFNGDQIAPAASAQNDLYVNVKGVKNSSDVDANGAGWINAETDEPNLRIELQSLVDVLGNTGNITSGTNEVSSTAINATEDAADDNRSDEFGVDFGASVLGDFDPTPNGMPADLNDVSAWIIFNNLDASADQDHDFEFTANEPPLADATAGSGTDEGDLSFQTDLFDGTAGGFAAIGAPTAGAPPNDVVAPFEHDQAGAFTNVTAEIALEADMTAHAAGAALATGAYHIVATVLDNATQQNIAVAEWWAVLVSGAAAINLIDAPAPTTTNAPTLTFTIKGEVTDVVVDLDDTGAFDDALPLASVTIIVHEDVGVDGCDDPTLPLTDDVVLAEGAAPAPIVDNNIDVAGILDSNNRFSQEVTLRNPGASTPTICFSVVTAIDAVDNDGNDDPVLGYDQANAVITWQ